MSADTWAKLAIDFPRDLERTYQGRGGKSFTYIEPRDVMERLDEVLTPAGWQFEARAVSDTVAHGRLSIKVGAEWIVREDFGYPNNSADIAESLKEAQSDALRRCAMAFGVARYLYRRETQPSRAAAAPPLAAAPRTTEEPPFPGMDGPTLVQQVFGDDVVDESKCPDHGYAWKTNSRGYFCSGKTNGKWCERKPSKAWAAAQELVPA